MAKGYPDYKTWAGRTALGETATSYSFGVDIGAGVTGSFDLPEVGDDTENVYQCLTISCLDDTAIHLVTLKYVVADWIFFLVTFITGGIFDFPGEVVSAGKTIRITITNNSAVDLQFIGAVNYTTRAV